MLNREQHRKLKSLSKDEMIKYLYRYYCEVYNEAIAETYMAVFRHLFDDYGFNNEQLESLFISSNGDIEAINQNYVTAEDIRAGLAEEGITFLKGVKL